MGGLKAGPQAWWQRLRVSGTKTRRDRSLPAARAPQAEVRQTLRLETCLSPGALAACDERDYVDWFEHAPIGYMLLDAAGTIEKINQTGAAMLGWETSWLVGKPFSRWVANNDKQLFHAHRQQTCSSGEALSPELRVKNRQGRLLDVRLKSRAAQTVDGRSPGCRCVLIDMSGEERAARRLRRLQAQLTHVARLQAAGELAASLAHELNQPLGTVVLNCQAAQRLLESNVQDPGEFAEVLTQATEAATFASEIVRRLRGFLKKGEALHRVCELSTLIHELTTLIEIDARDNDIQLLLDIEQAMPEVRVDPVQIQQVILNLAHNSIEAMSGQGAGGVNRVVIRAQQWPPDRIRVRVTDTGPGLTSRQTERVFDPFYTTKNNGVGIGLAISRTIIEAHGGQLWAETEIAAGAAFCFTLPTVELGCHAG